MLDALISAGANLLGNLFNKSSTSANNATQMQIASMNNATQMQMAQQNIALQKEFAQHGISWKVADAVAAGLHPLIGAGAQAQSFSPVSVGSSMPTTEASKFDFSSLGQDLGRAAKAMSTQAQREAVDAQKERQLDLESKALDNDLKRTTLGSRVLSTSRAGGQLGPPIPSPDLPRGWEAMVGGSRSPSRANEIALEGDSSKIKDVGAAAHKSMKLFGVYPMEMNPDVVSGQALEDEFGEHLGGILGAGNLPAHFIYDVKKNKWPWIYDRLPSIQYRRGR